MYIKTKKIICKYKNVLMILATIISTCIIYFNYLIGHFSAETYALAHGYESYAINVYIADGRIFSGLLMIFADLINIPIINLMSISLFLGICIAVIAIYKMKNTIMELLKINQKQEIIIWLICYTIIFNFIMIEMLHFPEACIMSLSILFNIIAANYFINNKYIKSAIFLFLGVFCYQATIGFFIVCCCLFSLMQNKGLKNLLNNFIKIGIISLVVAIINLSFIKIFTSLFQINQNKIFELNIETIYDNIIFIFKSVFKILSENCGLFPKYFLILFIQLVVIMASIITLKEKDFKIIINAIILLFITIVSSFVIFIVQKNSMFTGRVHFCIGSLVGIEFLYLYSSTTIKNYKFLKYFFYIILSTYILINIINTVQLTYEHQLVNKLEKEECKKIENIIEQYESQNNIIIKKIVPIAIFNEEENGFFKETIRRTIVTYNNIRHYFGFSSVINYYINRKLEATSITQNSQEKYLEYIINNNHEYGDVVCIDDSLYCPQYIF